MQRNWEGVEFQSQIIQGFGHDQLLMITIALSPCSTGLDLLHVQNLQHQMPRLYIADMCALALEMDY
jgi:hypothetical protein